MAGTGTINIAGNINLGALGNLIDSGSGQDTISGVISGTATFGDPALVQGLIGTYFNLTTSPGIGSLIQPAAPSNPPGWAIKPPPRRAARRAH